jgi:diguanylate cyclase
MTTSTRQHATQPWLELLDSYPVEVVDQLRTLVGEHAGALASLFYDKMLADPAASALLSHDQVKTRLHSSMQHWIINLFGVTSESDLQAVIAQQALVGDVHARIDVPVYLVLRGARYLKRGIATLLMEQPHLATPQQVLAIRYMSGLIDLAMEAMSQAYSSSHDRNSRASEAYRLFAVAQNLSTEKERQRAALFDWENQLMFALAVGQHAERLPLLGGSEFGLWFRHKGAHAFHGTDETDLILEGISRVDEVLLPLFTASEESVGNRVRYLRDLREQSKAIAYHLERLFEQNSELEAGRDVLTQLLNRKFLPTVLAKEVSYVRKTGTTFALLAIDIDHFKQINDRFGHEGGDMMLQQVVVLLSNNSRGGDYLFRLGGEEFLLVLVDITAQVALQVAEKLRGQIAAETFRLPRDQTTKATISIGVALHDGHPDYQHTLRLADDALYKAKHSGRNRVVHLKQQKPVAGNS